MKTLVQCKKKCIYIYIYTSSKPLKNIVKIFVYSKNIYYFCTDFNFVVQNISFNILVIRLHSQILSACKGS